MHGMVRNETPRILLQFCSMVRNSEHFSLPRNGFGTEFRDFCVPWNRRNSVGINQFFRLFRLPRNNFFVGNCQPYSLLIILFSVWQAEPAQMAIAPCLASWRGWGWSQSYLGDILAWDYFFGQWDYNCRSWAVCLGVMSNDTFKSVSRKKGGLWVFVSFHGDRCSFGVFLFSCKLP